jgi:hypothetical protein
MVKNSRYRPLCNTQQQTQPPLALAVPLSRFTSRVGGGSALVVRRFLHHDVWLILGLVSLGVGVVVGLLFRGVKAIVIGAIVPWLGLLACLLYHEYFVPYQGGGASMWPVAQLFGGTFAAAVGGSSAAIVRHFSRSK